MTHPWWVRPHSAISSSPPTDIPQKMTTHHAISSPSTSTRHLLLPPLAAPGPPPHPHPHAIYYTSCCPPPRTSLSHRHLLPLPLPLHSAIYYASCCPPTRTSLSRLSTSCISPGSAASHQIRLLMMAVSSTPAP